MKAATNSGVLDFEGHSPKLADDVFIAPGAHVIGNVSAKPGVSIWYNSVIRGDVCPISIGEETNVQDLCMIHGTTGGTGTIIGDRVTVGHHAILHGCTIGDETLIGMGAIILDDVVIGKGCLIGAGALITQGKVIPDGSVVLGSPGKIVRVVTATEAVQFLQSATHYRAMAKKHRAS